MLIILIGFLVLELWWITLAIPVLLAVGLFFQIKLSKDMMGFNIQRMGISDKRG